VKSAKKRLNVLITAGPTQEMIDPIRFISNRSTGVMGYEIAKAAKKRHHRVVLISGPVSIKPPYGVKFVPVVSADELKREVLTRIKKTDCLFMVAAVSDWRAKSFKKHKIRRSNKQLKVELKATPDILKLAAKRKTRQIFVGFSLETKDARKSSVKKLKNKRLDLIAVNKFTRTQNPFGNRRTRVSVIHRSGRREDLPLLSKRDVALALLDRVEELHKD